MRLSARHFADTKNRQGYAARHNLQNGVQLMMNQRFLCKMAEGSNLLSSALPVMNRIQKKGKFNRKTM